MNRMKFGRVSTEGMTQTSKDLMLEFTDLLVQNRALGTGALRKADEKGQYSIYVFGKEITGAELKGQPDVGDFLKRAIIGEYEKYKQGKEHGLEEAGIAYFLAHHVVIESVEKGGLSFSNLDNVVRQFARNIDAVSKSKYVEAGDEVEKKLKKGAGYLIEYPEEFQSLPDDTTLLRLTKEILQKEIDEYNNSNDPTSRIFGKSRDFASQHSTILNVDDKTRSVVIGNQNCTVRFSGPGQDAFVTIKINVYAEDMQKTESGGIIPVGKLNFQQTRKDAESMGDKPFLRAERIDAFVETIAEDDARVKALQELFNQHSGKKAGIRNIELGHILSLGAVRTNQLIESMQHLSKDFKSSELDVLLRTLKKASQFMEKIDSIFLGGNVETKLTAQDLMKFVLENDGKLPEGHVNIIQEVDGAKVIASHKLSKEAHFLLEPSQMNIIKGNAAGQIRDLLMEAVAVQLGGTMDPMPENLATLLAYIKSSDSLIVAGIKTLLGVKFEKSKGKNRQKSRIKVGLFKKFPKTTKPGSSRPPKIKPEEATTRHYRGVQDLGPRQQSPADTGALVSEINSKLHAAIKARMQSPALNYRTGRFASSAQVTSIVDNRLSYTYLKNPYEIFEQGQSRKASAQRDPKTIIGGAIRDILGPSRMGRYMLARV